MPTRQTLKDEGMKQLQQLLPSYNISHEYLKIRLLIFIAMYIIAIPIQSQTGYKHPETSTALEQILETDQGVRVKFKSVFRQFGENSPEFRAVGKEMSRVDSINQLSIKHILDQYGWLTPPDVSEKASNAFFYVIQHAPFEYQKQYKPLVIEAFKSGSIDSAQYMMFIDRIILREGKYQIYGTQTYRDNIGNEYFIPIDTTANSQYQKFPDAYKDKFLLYSNPQLTALFVHTFDQKSNVGVANVDIFLDDTKIGATNDTGFFQILIPRVDKEQKLTIRNVEKNINIRLKPDKTRDFYDQHFGF